MAAEEAALTVRDNKQADADLSESPQANAAFYESGLLELLDGVRPRYCSRRAREILLEDFRRAAEGLDDPARAVAVDCLTGNGVHIAKYLDAGFGRVIGVDLSPSEVAKAKERYANEPRVEFHVAEIGEFFRQRPGPYDFIYLNSLHHIPDYLGLVRQAAGCTSEGGFLYVLEGVQRGRIRRLITKLDENMHQVLHCPRLWLGKVLGKLGLYRGRVARMWELAKAAEVHAGAGLDEGAILAHLRGAGFRVVVHEHVFLPATMITYLLLRPFGYSTAFRLLVQRKLR